MDGGPLAINQGREAVQKLNLVQKTITGNVRPRAAKAVGGSANQQFRHRWRNEIPPGLLVQEAVTGPFGHFGWVVKWRGCRSNCLAKWISARGV